MNELTPGWKLFRVICIIQLIVVSIELILAAIGFVNKQGFFYSVVSVGTYLLIFIFVYQGLSLINYNYPDNPLSVKQKKQFNWLFLLNFLLIAFLFGQIVNEWRNVVPILQAINGSVTDYLYYGFSLILSLLLFAFHIVFLAGMYNLRRLIHQNTVETWQEQFSDSKTT